jgi:histone H1/5
MIKEAITALNDSTGSSSYAIAKYMEEHHKDELPANYKKVLATQLKNFTAKGKLVKVRASFKLKEDEALKKKKKKPVKKEIIKIPTKARSKRKAPAVMSAETKKKGARSTRVKKAKKAAQPKPKQPKSIKSGTSKKANKAVAG